MQYVYDYKNKYVFLPSFCMVSFNFPSSLENSTSGVIFGGGLLNFRVINISLRSLAVGDSRWKLVYGCWRLEFQFF